MRKRTKKGTRSGSRRRLITLNPNAAGIDVGSEEMYVCVPPDRDQQPIRKFGSFTEELKRLIEWLKQCRVDTVAIESTGVYWIPLYEMLEEAGIDVRLVNPRELKKTKKTDVIDCEWLQQMHTYGLLAASFRPPDEICALRALVRHRQKLIRYRAAQVQHMQKALHQMNIKLDNVIRDITGVSGTAIIREILKGERNPEVLAAYRDPRCKNSEEVIRKSLEGNYRKEHLFTLKQAVESFDFLSQQISACNEEIEQMYTQFDDRTKGNPPDQQSRKKLRQGRNDPDFELQEYLRKLCGVDLTAIEGIGPLTVQAVVTEGGIDMTKFPTVQHWASWLVLAPNNRKSGGKQLRPDGKKRKSRAGQALREAVRSLHHSDSWLGVYYRRMKSIHGPAKANKMTAHKIARIMYFMLRNQQEYDKTLYDLHEKKRRTKVIAGLKQKAKEYGFTLVAAT